MCEPDPNHRLVQCEIPLDMEEQSLVVGDEHKESEPNGPNGVLIRAEDVDTTIDLHKPYGE